MITLYHCVSARSFRPLWMLEELGLPYELKMLPFPPRVLARSYLDLNPLGTVPLMINGHTRMTESAAICEYLCALSAPTSLQVELAEDDYGAYLNYLHFGEATLTFPQTLVLRALRTRTSALANCCGRLWKVVSGQAAHIGAHTGPAGVSVCRPLHSGGCLCWICVAAGAAPWPRRPFYAGGESVLGASAAQRGLLPRSAIPKRCCISARCFDGSRPR